MRSTLFALVLMLSAALAGAETVTIQVQGMSCSGCAGTVSVGAQTR